MKQQGLALVPFSHTSIFRSLSAGVGRQICLCPVLASHALAISTNSQHILFNQPLMSCYFPTGNSHSADADAAVLQEWPSSCSSSRMSPLAVLQEWPSSWSSLRMSILLQFFKNVCPLAVLQEWPSSCSSLRMAILLQFFKNVCPLAVLQEWPSSCSSSRMSILRGRCAPTSYCDTREASAQRYLAVLSTRQIYQI